MRKGKEEERETERERDRERGKGGREGWREERGEKRKEGKEKQYKDREKRDERSEEGERELHNLPPLFSYLHPHVLHPALAHPGLSSFCSHSSSCSPFSSAPLVSSSSHESFHELLLLLLLPLSHFLSCDLFFFRALCPLCPLLYSGHWTLHNSYY